MLETEQQRISPSSWKKEINDPYIYFDIESEIKMIDLFRLESEFLYLLRRTKIEIWVPIAVVCAQMRFDIAASVRNTTLLRPLCTAVHVNPDHNAKLGFCGCGSFRIRKIAGVILFVDHFFNPWLWQSQAMFHINFFFLFSCSTDLRQ